MDVQVIYVDFELLAEPEIGLWCDRCFLPSVVGFLGVVTFDDRPHQIRRFLICTECKRVTNGDA